MSEVKVEIFSEFKKGEKVYGVEICIDSMAMVLRQPRRRYESYNEAAIKREQLETKLKNPKQ